jgi:hypothetical protein
MPVQSRVHLESQGILPGVVDYQHPVDQSDSRHAAPVEESPDSVIYLLPLSGSRTSRGVASYGQYRSLPEVSQPQDGQRRNDCFLPRNGRSGTKRKRKNKGSPQNHIRSVTASDPISRMRLALQAFMICLPVNCGMFFPGVLSPVPRMPVVHQPLAPVHGSDPALRVRGKRGLSRFLQRESPRPQRPPRMP